MKFLKKNMKSIALVPVIFLSTYSHALTDQCSASVDLTWRGGEQSKFAVNFTSTRTALTFKKARERARNNAENCLNDMWASRWELNGQSDRAFLPASCIDSAISGIDDDEIDVKERIAEAACDAWLFDIHNNQTWDGKWGITVVVEGVVSGNKGCSSSRVLSSTYNIYPDMCY